MTPEDHQNRGENGTAREPGRGRDAARPGDIPVRGLRDVFWRVVAQVREDRVTLVAAGVTFYVLLALFPALTSLVSMYGLISDPAVIAEQVNLLAAVMPSQSLQLVTDQLQAITSQRASSLGIGFVVGLLVALWSARNGIAALIEAMNIAYDEEERRGFVRLTLLSLGFTIGSLLVTAVVIAAIGVMPAILAVVPRGQWLESIAKFVRWPVLLLLIGAGIALLYRYGPDRDPPKLRWLTWGAAFSTLCWLPASLLFSFYIDNFANYNATYGAMGALIGFMLWIWVSTIIIIVGAELNAELEHQTARDSTTGPPKKMGKRGAYVADTVGEAED
ncbi:YihY/virulence factor BrkB family protein [Ensifer sp. IC4062]|nr:YihY/virulence factor BrkB family protein [Ensifer sp. IC4062]MCA1440286.1 YihY/virulence factor BrkB family protein [Ensifer sp. IC4062]